MLQTWAGDHTLVRADHFFWILGAAIQKTVEGLLRSLLYSILLTLLQSDVAADIEAARAICGPRWASSNKRRTWNRKELRDTLARLPTAPKMKFLFSVDALDECGPQDQLDRLAEEIIWISRLPNVKICVSCRPWRAFTGKFKNAPSLHLDQLTYHDMELYVESQFIDAEAALDSSSQFRDGDIAATDLIRALIASAEGVFLWLRIVTEELCTELRKGSTLEQLYQISAGIPKDLSDYYHDLIFDRIGKSRRNVLDTAAALGLAVEIAIAKDGQVSEPSKRTDDSFPLPDSFCNFWLLHKGYLRPGFSWRDRIDTARLNVKQMIHQTALFLDETCKDLLVVRACGKSMPGVNFVHRTVFDFLCEKDSRLDLEHNAPAHFSDADFLYELAKLRCICLLSCEPERCQDSLYVLEDALTQTHFRWESSQLMDFPAWFSACESLMLTQMRTRCNCLGLGHFPFWESEFLEAGRYHFLGNVIAGMPLQIFQKTLFGENRSFLGRILRTAILVDIGDAGMALLHQILDFGAHPNELESHGPGFRINVASKNTEWCLRTYWEAWVSTVYIRQQQSDGVSGSDASERQDAKTHVAHWQDTYWAAITTLLLRHGANTECTPCVTDHSMEPITDQKCRHVPVSTLLQQILPGGCVLPLRSMRSSHSNALRRNQHMRIFKSFLTSEHNLMTQVRNAGLPPDEQFLVLSVLYEDHWCLLETMMDLRDSVSVKDHCDRCSEYIGIGGLVAWCVDCEAVSFSCIRCSESVPFEAPSLKHLCDETPNLLFSKNHTSIVAAFNVPIYHVEGDYKALKLLKLRHTNFQALVVLREWYSKNPAESIDPSEKASAGTATSPGRLRRRQSLQEKKGGESDKRSGKYNKQLPSRRLNIFGL